MFFIESIMSNLFPITTQDKLEGTEATISITPSKDYPAINYKTGDGNWKGVIEGTKFRPIHLSELSRKLKSRGWNIGHRSFLVDGELWDGLEVIPEYLPSKALLSSGLSKRVSWGTDLRLVYNEIKSESKYEKILEEMTGQEINLFSTSTRGIDLVSGKQTIDVVSINGDSYTNMISLVPLKEHIISEGISAKVDLMIAYVSSGSPLYHYTTFQAFSYEKGKNGEVGLVEEPWIEDVGEDVRVEYVNGILRVLPLTSKITECIISNCTVEYGRNN